MPFGCGGRYFSELRTPNRKIQRTTRLRPQPAEHLIIRGEETLRPWLCIGLALKSGFEEDAHIVKATAQKDVRELPAYGIAEAAHYLRVPRATLRSWVAGMSYGSEPDRRFFQPVIEAAGKSPVALSFINLVEAHVLAAIRRKHRVDMPAVRRSVDFLQNELGSAHPLADHKFETNGIDLFISHYGQFIAVSQGGQLAVRDLLEAHLRRVERDDHGVPIRLYPFTRMGSPEAPASAVRGSSSRTAPLSSRSRICSW